MPVRERNSLEGSENQIPKSLRQIDATTDISFDHSYLTGYGENDPTLKMKTKTRTRHFELGNVLLFSEYAIFR